MKNNRYVWQLELNWIYCLIFIYFQPIQTNRWASDIFKKIRTASTNNNNKRQTNSHERIFLNCCSSIRCPYYCCCFPIFHFLRQSFSFFVNKTYAHNSYMCVYLCVPIKSKICCWFFIIIVVAAQDFSVVNLTLHCCCLYYNAPTTTLNINIVNKAQWFKIMCER